MKKAVFNGPGEPFKIIDDVIPEVPSEGALIKTTYSGVCHSDVHMRKSEINLGDGIIISPYKLFGEKYLGTTFGHEIAGTVIAFGDKANPDAQNLKIGDNVVVYPWIGCQNCDVCKMGMGNMCEKPQDIGVAPMYSGGYATHVPVPKCHYLIKVPDNLPSSVACMLPCSGATSYASLLKVTPQLKQAIKVRGQANLLLIGAGGLGLWCVQLAKKGLFKDDKVNVIVADISEAKVAGAVSMGADEGILWERDATLEETCQKSTKNNERKMDAIINFVGTPKTSEVGVKCLHSGGILLIIGLAGGSMKVSIPTLALGSKTISGSKTSTIQELEDLVELVSRLEMRYESLQSLPLEKVNYALDELEAGTLNGRAVLKFD